MQISTNDKAILRSLAEKVAELAARPVEAEKRQLWLDHNALKPTRPLVFCDPENGWGEIIPDHSLDCRTKPARDWEWILRREIFWGEQMGDDRVIEPFWNVSHVALDTGWGVSTVKAKGHEDGSYVWDPPIKSYDQVDQYPVPSLTFDQEATDQMLEAAGEVFCGILPIRLKNSWFWTTGLTGTLALLRGLEQIMIDMIDDPANLHRIMAFLRDEMIARLKHLEDSNMLTLNNDGAYVGSGGFGWSSELPGEGYDGRVRLRDLWCLSESQETVSISPKMFAEFVLPYQLPIINLFGLCCYGCCEPLEKRWNYIKAIPNLRRVSVSPWSDREAMAENLEDKYVYSMKPNPADLAMDAVDTDRLRRQLREDLATTRGCRVEVIMKDCHTIRSEPQRVIEWTRIAREESERIGAG